MAEIIVSINTAKDGSRGQYEGFEITGKDETNNRGFKQFMFKTTQGGENTKQFALCKDLKRGDRVSFTTVTNAKGYEDIVDAKVLSLGPAAGGSGGGGKKSYGGGGGGKGGMSKAEWAAKDAKKEASIARSVALKCAIDCYTAPGKEITAAKMKQLEDLTGRFQSFLITGDFDGKLPEPEAPADTPAEPQTQPGDPGPGAGEDDIPF